MIMAQCRNRAARFVLNGFAVNLGTADHRYIPFAEPLNHRAYGF